jgi:hypothetical protein
MAAEDESVRVQLARIEGKMDLSNMRHDKTEERINTHEKRLNRHSDDISTLQAKALLREGERKGLTTAGRFAWALIGSVPAAAAGAALMKLLGN